MKIAELIPSPIDLLALAPEELAGIVLRVLIAQSTNGGSISRYNFSLAYTFDGYEQRYVAECQRATMEAWTVLERDGLVAPQPENDSWYFITRRGFSLTSEEDYRSFRKASLFPLLSIHPLIKDVYPLFLRGDYETAVFQAFKMLEVAVRNACPTLDQKLLGVDLMRKAFHPDSGPLTNPSEHFAEREALAALFSGAIGRFKNPASHRHVPMESASEAVELLQLASNLMRVVTERECKNSGDDI